MTDFSNNIPEFITKLFKILSDNSISHIISWNNNSTSFIVKDSAEFSKYLLPLNFKHNNFASFVRQLNKYNFHKVKNSDDLKTFGSQSWEFYNELFQKNRPDLLESIKRKLTTKKPSKVSENLNINTQLQFTNNESNSTTDDVKDSFIIQKMEYLENSQKEMGQHLKTLAIGYQNILQKLAHFENVIKNQDQIISNFLSKDFSSANLPPLNNHQRTPSGTHLPPLNNHQRTPSGTHLPPLNNHQRTSSGIHEELDKLINIYSSNDNHPSNEQLHSPNSMESATLFQPFNDNYSSNISSLQKQKRKYYPDDNSGSSPEIMPRKRNSQDYQNSFEHADQESSPQPTFYPSSSNDNPIPTKIFFQTSSSPTPKPNWTTPPKILLVEDDDTCRRLSSKLLQIFGCNFDIAVDGLDAVNRMGFGCKYDIVLMDIVMPNLDGVSATTRIRQFDQSTPIISMTSNTTENDCMNYLANGMNDILAKPFNKASLLGIILRYCSNISIDEEDKKKDKIIEFLSDSMLGGSGNGKLDLMDMLGLDVMNSSPKKRLNEKSKDAS